MLFCEISLSVNFCNLQQIYRCLIYKWATACYRNYSAYGLWMHRSKKRFFTFECTNPEQLYPPIGSAGKITIVSHCLCHGLRVFGLRRSKALIRWWLRDSNYQKQ